MPPHDTGASPACIRFDGVRKTYRTSKAAVVAVDNVSFEVRPGEVVGLLGPNGAGKTTLLRMLGRLVVPDAGRVSIADVDVTTLGARALDPIGIVLEGGQDIHERLTPLENIEYFGRLMGMEPRVSRDRGAALLARFGLEKKAHAQARQLSRGMRQAVSLCVGLVHDPRFLVMDEPTVGLDPSAIVSLTNLILELKTRDLGMLIATHDLGFIQAVADRILIVGAGRILKEVASPAGVPGSDCQEFRIRLAQPWTWSEGAQHLSHCARLSPISDGVEVSCASRDLARVLDLLAPYGILHLESQRHNVMDEYLAAQSQVSAVRRAAA